jgi:N-acetyl-anhydromuramyl-L-alanine amidase AmpD
MDNWNIMSDKYAGHYVVGREGKIYNCIPEEYWTNHLGGHKKFSDLNKSTIAIFLCNELYLEKENSKFYAFGFNKPHNLYKGKVFEQAFMNYNHWADYDEAQIDALAVLLNDVCTRQKISKTFYKNSTKYRPNAAERAGILFCANVNDRSYSLPLPSWAANRLETHGLSPTE